MLELVDPQYKESVAEKLAELPATPGVYIHKNAAGEIIYIGKAISLKNRVRSYFQSPKNHPPKVIAMVRNIADFEYILCANESEALTLESNLIKQHRPRYKISLKDDKHFPYAKININTPFPRIEIVHSIKKNDSSKYLGPYLSKYALKEALESVRDSFPLRTCKKDILKSLARNERPCLNYHIGKCCAPCYGKISQADYNLLVEQVVAFLSGKTEGVIAQMKQEMMDAAEMLDFEKAALIRNRIAHIKLISQKQKAATASTDERDVLSVARLGNDVVVYLLFVRSGKVVGTDAVSLIAPDHTNQEIISSFITQYYASGTYIPRELTVSHLPEDTAIIATWLGRSLKHKVNIVEPIRGDKKKLIEMATRNGEEYLEKAASAKRKMWERTEGAIKDLASLLHLKAPPKRIEAFDISHTAGTDPVASMVVFEGGKPNNKLYRRFRVKNSANDDFAAMREVLTRRFERAIAERAQGKQDGFAALPDLLLIDGGKGQVSTALGVLDALALTGKIEMIGLAERLEEVFLPNQSEPIILETGCPALHLLQRVRDEAHRFAITYHRSLRQKTMLFSELDPIEGVGKKRKKILFDAFVSFDAIKNATFDQLIATPGIDKRTANAIISYFEHIDEAQPPN